MLLHRQQLAGRWTKGLSAGGCRNCTSYSSNPKFWLRVAERGEVLVSLHQQRGGAECYAQTPLGGGHNTKHQHYQAIALHMWKVSGVKTVFCSYCAQCCKLSLTFESG